MRIVNVLALVCLVSGLSACAGSKNVETAALEYTQDEATVLIDRGLDEKFGLKPSAEKARERVAIYNGTSYKVSSVNKRSETEAEITIAIDQPAGGQQKKVKLVASLEKSQWKLTPAASDRVTASVK